jgi:carboxypeptidase PM20D1
MTKSRHCLLLGVAFLLAAPAAAAETETTAHPQAAAQALDLARKAIALRSVQGPGNQTIDVARLFKGALVAGGWADGDVEIVPVDDTAYLIATWKGSDPKLKPIVISGHMDVVEAKPSDWERDPFTPIVENGFLYGRGAADMKLSGALAIAALIELRRQGYTPKRGIVIEFSGDEETTMKTSAIIAERLKDSAMVINVDGGGGELDEVTGKPVYFSWDGAEKTYADYALTVTNAGGHSSRPRSDNAINQLAAALVKIAGYRFKPELNAITKAWFEKAAPLEPDAKTGAAMKAFAADPTDPAAIALLASNPATVGRIGTTCVATMLSGGHALNALPQKATANVNCRIFPGHSREAILAELKGVVADPGVVLSDVTEGSVATAASPLDPVFVKAVEAAIQKIHPGIPVIPVQSSGASDSMWFRFHGVPSYGASPLFIKNSDEFAHGLNERMPVFNIAPGVRYFLSLLSDLTRQ